MKSKPILAFFGAFNPPTVAHIVLAKLAMEKTGRGGVLFVPSQQRYIAFEQQKSFSFSDEERLHMLQLIAKENPWMRVTDWELRQERQPRTYETLCYLREEGYRPSLLLGSDKLPELECGWLHVPDIAREFGMVCLCRSGDDAVRLIRSDVYLSTLEEYIEVVQTPEDFQQVSSTAVRTLLQKMDQADAAAAEEALAGLVPLPLLNYLLKKAS